jgi:hypothetical protein
MSDEVKKILGHRSEKPRPTSRRPAQRWGVLILAILVLPLFLGAWRDVSGNTINPKYVERIKDGQTTKQEILLLFGDPQDIQHPPEGTIFTYKSFKDAPQLPYRPEERKIAPQSDRIYVIDDNKQIKKPPLKTQGTILRSTLVVRFKPDGQTVQSHAYQEVKGSAE